MSILKSHCLLVIFVWGCTVSAERQDRECLEERLHVQRTVGKRGEKGEQGKVDYERIYKRIDDKLEAAIADMTRQLDETIEELRTKRNSASSEEATLPPTKPTFPGICIGPTYKGMCFWAERIDTPITFQKGESLCKAKRGSAAGIYSPEHFDQMSTYLRSLLPPNTPFLNFWIGLRIIPETKEIDTGNELRTYHTSWYPYYPSKVQSRTHIVWQVAREANAQWQGMWNQTPLSSYNGILCQM